LSKTTARFFFCNRYPPSCNFWIEENLPEDRMTFGSAVAFRHRFITDIVRGPQADRLVVR